MNLLLRPQGSKSFIRSTTTRHCLVFFLAFLLTSGFAWADPQISGVAGPATQNEGLTIRGAHFGPKDPPGPAVWDDCTSKACLSEHYDGYKPKASQQGALYNIQYRLPGFREIHPPHRNAPYFIGGAHAIDRPSNGNEAGGNVCLGKNIASEAFFISYYYRLDPLFDEEDHPRYRDNMKELVLSNTPGRFYPDEKESFGYIAWCSNTVPDSRYTDPVRISRLPINPAHHERPYDCDSDPYVVFHRNPARGWIKMQWEGEYDDTFHSPKIALTTYPDGKKTYRSHFGDGITVHEYIRGLWIGFPRRGDLRFVGIGGFARIPRKNDGVNSFRYFCSVYMDSTLARVVLCDRPDYATATIVEPQPPTTWTDTSIKITVNQGALPAGTTAYLFVFDSAARRNNRGFPVRLDGTSD